MNGPPAKPNPHSAVWLRYELSYRVSGTAVTGHASMQSNPKDSPRSEWMTKHIRLLSAPAVQKGAVNIESFTRQDVKNRFSMASP